MDAPETTARERPFGLSVLAIGAVSVGALALLRAVTC